MPQKKAGGTSGHQENGFCGKIILGQSSKFESQYGE